MIQIIIGFMAKYLFFSGPNYPRCSIFGLKLLQDDKASAVVSKWQDQPMLCIREDIMHTNYNYVHLYRRCAMYNMHTVHG